MSRRQHGRRWLLAAALALAAGAAQAGIAVIVNPQAGVEQLSKAQVKAIFLGKRKKLPSGEAAQPVNQDEASPLYAAFAKKVLGKSPARLKSYWSAQIFSGRATPPKAVGGDDAVKRFVASTPGGIGYVDSAAVDGSVRVVLEVE